MIRICSYPSIEVVADELRQNEEQFAEILADIARRITVPQQQELRGYLIENMTPELRGFLRFLGGVGESAPG